MGNNFKLAENEIENLCEYGGMAPSGGNIQPWLVTVMGNKLELRVDPKRSGNFLDIGKYASIFSIGSFVENVCIVADNLGLAYTVEISNFKKENDPICTILFQGIREKGKLAYLYNYVSKRVTNRQFYDGSIIPDKIITFLKELMSNSKRVRCKLHTLYEHEEKVRAAEILGRADVIRTRNKKLFSQMMEELRWSQKEVYSTRDGMDIKTMELPANAAKMLALLKRFPSMGKILPEKALRDMAKPLLVGCSHLCVLTLEDEFNYQNLFELGRCLENLWLNVTKLGFSLHPWTILPFLLIRAELFPKDGFSLEEEKEVKEIGLDLKNLFNIGIKEKPIFIFRLSKTKSPSVRSLRRDWRDYTEFKKIS